MKNYLEQAIFSICESVSYDSSLAQPQEGMPFGKGAADCLNHFLTLAQEMGFETNNYDNYVGEVLFGEGEPFAILAHLDVVPAGQGWNTPPFEATRKEGKIFGRGTMDDKGPAIASLYALKMLKDEGFTPNRKIKLIVGCNEECGWACIDHYQKLAALPEEGFSPDADFPVIYAEKGICHFTARFPVHGTPFSHFQGGAAANMVCDYCEAISPAYDLEKAATLGLTVENGKLVSHGKSAHGSTPEKGENAILPLLRYYAENEEIQRVIDCLFEDIYGLKTLCDETGNLTLSPDVIAFDGNALTVTSDVRYPASLPLSAVTERIEKFGVEYEIVNHSLPLYHEKDGALVSTLCKIYNEFSGKQSEPIAIGGGTYARALKMGVAFGPEVEGEEVTIHQPNEYITVERIELMLYVYKKAIEQLTK